MKSKKFAAVVIAVMMTLPIGGKVKVKTVTPQTTYAAEKLSDLPLSITIDVTDNGEAEGFTLTRKGKKVMIIGNDGAGAIYAANKLKELFEADPTLDGLSTLSEVPQMKLRGACVGLQKTVYLPGHRVYETPCICGTDILLHR